MIQIFASESLSRPMSYPVVARNSLRKPFAVIASATGALMIAVKKSEAVSGAVSKSTVEESQTAARQLLEMSRKVTEMEKMSGGGDWEGVAGILNDRLFTDFDKIASVLVRSDDISAEDKIALGTIKRYGLVADAIIMIGGLGAVLKAGGVKGMKSGGSAYADQKAIEDDEEDEEDDSNSATKTVDSAEAIKFVKLVKGALGDINRIVAQSKIKI